MQLTFLGKSAHELGVKVVLEVESLKAREVERARKVFIYFDFYHLPSASFNEFGTVS